MAKLRATCPNCGAVELPPNAFDFRWCSYGPASYYEFTCTGCQASVRKPADEATAQLLIAGGVRPNLWHMPLEALELRVGPPLNYDDLIDFHNELGREDWFDRLQETTPSASCG
jgi:hypothetical protein